MVDPRCDLELVVLLTFMVLRNGVVSIVSDKLFVNDTGWTGVFVYQDNRSADAGMSWYCWFNHTVPTPPLGIPNNKLHNLVVSLNLRARGLRAHLAYDSSYSHASQDVGVLGHPLEACKAVGSRLPWITTSSMKDLPVVVFGGS